MGAWQALTGDVLGALVTDSIRVALPFISSGISAGLSANQILSGLTAGGIGVNRARGLKVIAALKTPFGYPGWIKGTSADMYPGADLFRVAPFPTGSKYTYVYTVTGKNPLTGALETQHFNIVSDTLLTNDTADALAGSFGEGGSSGNALVDVTATLDVVKLSPDFNM